MPLREAGTLNVNVHGDALRQQLLDRIWLGIFIIAIIGLPASLSRAFSTGWLQLYTFHTVMAALVFVIFALRKRLTYTMRASILMAMFFMVGAAGILTLGLLGAGLWWLVMCSFMTGTLFSYKAGLYVSAISLTIVGLAGYLFTSGSVLHPVDVSEYVVNPTSWISFLVAVSILPLMVFQSIAIFQSSAFDMLSEIARQKREIERLATHDQLTGLPLLNLAKDRLQQAINAADRSGRQVALFFIDLDGFKAANDQYGHDAGDAILTEFSNRLRTCVRDVDTAARIGGDEFIVVLPEIETRDTAAKVAERIVRAASQSLTFQGTPLSYGASIGIALYPNDAETADTLRRQADHAMYSVKRAEKNNFRFIEDVVAHKRPAAG